MEVAVDKCDCEGGREIGHANHTGTDTHTHTHTHAHTPSTCINHKQYTVKSVDENYAFKNNVGVSDRAVYLLNSVLEFGMFKDAFS